MRLLRNRGGDEGGGAASRYQMREKLLSIGHDYWIDDDDRNSAFHVDGKALRVRKTFVIEDAAGNEVAKIQERKLSVRDKMAIERGGESGATVKKALVGLRDRFSIDLENGGQLKAKGNLVDHEYEVERDGNTIATVSKRWFRVRDTYGVEIAPDEAAGLILAITVCVDAMTDRVD